MYTFAFINRQSGVALIFSLLLLLVLTIVAVATFSGATLQERMAGNANVQALSFEAASSGITEMMEWGLDKDNWPTVDGEPRVCVRGNENWLGEWEPALGQDGTPLEIVGIPEGLRVEYRKRLGCFEAPEWELLTGSTFPPPQQLLALSRGQVVRDSDDAVLAEREIEVRLERRGGNPTCLMQTGPLDKVQLTMPDSGAFGIDARPGGCPIKTMWDEDAEAMRGQLGDNQVGNYQPTDPGITSGALDGTWGNAKMLARAVNAVKIGIRAYEEWEPLENNPFQSCAGTLYESDQDWGNSCEHTVAGGLTYIAGDLDVGGGCVLDGMIISEGDFLSNGTPAYLGDMVFLGGELDVRGFGYAGNSGLFILHNLGVNGDPNSERIAYTEPASAGFDESDFIIRGGGNATIEPRDCESLTEPWDALNNCLIDLQDMVDDGSFETNLEALGENVLAGFDEPDLLYEGDPVRFPLPSCDPDVGKRDAIASWREFIDRGRWDD